MKTTLVRWPRKGFPTGCAIAHLEHIHEYDGLHTSIPSLNRGLDGIQPARTAKDVRTRMYVHINGSYKQFLRQF